MTAAIAVDVKFEAGHRLPHIPGKCQSLHGHSWHAKIEVTAPLGQDDRGMVVEFSPFKRQLRDWIDTHLDHGLMLGHDDPLLPVLIEHGKVCAFTAYDYNWPTVENVAVLIARVAQGILAGVPHAPQAYVSRVDVREKHDNSASWIGARP